MRISPTTNNPESSRSHIFYNFEITFGVSKSPPANLVIVLIWLEPRIQWQIKKDFLSISSDTQVDLTNHKPRKYLSLPLYQLQKLAKTIPDVIEAEYDKNIKFTHTVYEYKNKKLPNIFKQFNPDKDLQKEQIDDEGIYHIT